MDPRRVGDVRKMMIDDRSSHEAWVHAALREDRKLMHRQINLACNENVLSLAGEAALSSDYYSRYFLGTCEGRGYETTTVLNGLVLGNLPGLNRIEERAHAAACTLFGSSHVETRFLSGLHCAATAILGLSNPGDTIWSLDPQMSAGHFATRGIAQCSGRRHDYLPWNVEGHDFDASEISRRVKQHTPQLIFLDCGAPLFPLQLTSLRDIVGDQTLIVYDASHSLGLIAGGRFQAPLRDGADLLQGNTHKSFPGPPKAIALSNDASISAVVAETLSCATVSSQETAATAALHVTMLEMLEHAADYAEALTDNAQIFGRELAAHGLSLFKVGAEFTESHILLVTFDSDDKTSKVARRLIEAGLLCNARRIYGKATLRIGMQEITRRGIEYFDLKELARIFAAIVKDEATSGDFDGISEMSRRLSGREYGWGAATESVMSRDIEVSRSVDQTL